ncbi:MAG: energy transducer TonB [Deltaproteobacteria bacterium]|nr:energy transducer TonB [Deltaproteobacteria bacterium]
MKKRSRMTVFALFAALLVCAPAAADLPQFGTFVSAKPVERRNPSYPATAISRWKEGWVVVSYCIDATGAVRDPVIDRSSGAKEFERAALNSIPKWKYEPATLDGAPVEQCATQVRLSFNMEGPLGARQEFAKPWRAAQKLIDANDLAGAEAKLSELVPENNYESARMHFARARIAEKRNDRRAQYEETQSARRFEYGVEKRLKADATRSAFALATNLQLWADALSLYEELKTEYPKELSEPLRNVGEEIAGKVKGDKAIATAGELTCRCDKEAQPALWEARLLRREFGFVDVVGKIERFELRCQGRRFTAKFETAKNWRVPDEWGACRLYVFGDEGAKFRLIEMPDAATAQAQPATKSNEQS